VWKWGVSSTLEHLSTCSLLVSLSQPSFVVLNVDDFRLLNNLFCQDACSDSKTKKNKTVNIHVSIYVHPNVLQRILDYRYIFRD